MECTSSMVASIVLTGKYNIGLNAKEKIKVDGHIIAMSDIPFIRYRFGKYDSSDIDFIVKNKAVFHRPVHLIEVMLDDDIADTLSKLEEIDGVAKFLYVPIDDADIKDGLSEHKRELLESVADVFVDRVMMKDNAEMLYPIAAEKLKLEIEDCCGFSASDIGICGSSLSFRCGDEPGQACLTAVWARNIMADYAESDDVVVPSASHESMECCGCIRHFIVDHDLPAPLSSKEKASNKEDGHKDKNSTPKEKMAKPAKPKAKVCWDSDI